MRQSFRGLLAAPLIVCASVADAGTIAYLGIGPADEATETTVDDTPFAIGVLGWTDGSPLVFGVDIAGEGTMLDSTFGQDSFRQAVSLNFLLGTNVTEWDRGRVDAAALIGIRESFADCPDSFLGFQCYADEAPDTEWDINYGGLVAVSFDRVSVGLRVTGESVMAILGVRF
jgi:hypothetical protein